MPRPTNDELSEKALLASQGLKRCRACREVIPLGMFGAYGRSPDGRQSLCKSCINKRNRVYDKSSWDKDPVAYRERKKAEKARYKERYPDRYSEAVRKRNIGKYGLTPEGFQALFEKQDGKCLICETALTEGRGTHIDHCHSTGVVRGLLCGGCNVGLGAFRDSPEILRSAATYLEKFIIAG